MTQLADDDFTKLTALWHSAVDAHRRGEQNVAISGYREVLLAQPAHPAANFLLGTLLRERGELDQAEARFHVALGAAPDLVDARVALANLRRERGDAAEALALCTEGLAREPDHVGLLRVLGLCALARHDADAARAAFERALARDPDDAITHFNHGTALQMQRATSAAAAAYRRSLALDPGLAAAEFNLGVLFIEQGQIDAAVQAFERVLAVDPKSVAAHKAMCEALRGAKRIDAWLAAFLRFEAACPSALALAAQALEAHQYRGDFDGVERVIEGLANERFVASSQEERIDSLGEILYLLLFFDVAPAMHLSFYRAYDRVARSAFGEPLPARGARGSGRTRVGYLSGDLRNHVMGKMIWQAFQHHDRDRFELFCYSLSDEADDWTDRFCGRADHFTVLAQMSDPDAVRAIENDDLDILVDLSTHTKGARPGILARKPARVQITHVASAGAVGLSAIDFKLTDRFADLPENRESMIETLLPIDGCAYPYRHIAPAAEHPFHRDRLGIAADAIVIGAFFTPMKLSRRCLALWREVIARLPRARLAFSPLSFAVRGAYLRLAAAAGIPADRVMFLPQGRNDAENQARYTVIDFVLDSMPFGGVNGTLEALDMAVPVVTLCGRKHAERASYSILANLGVVETVAQSAQQYVAIAARLAEDPEFRAGVVARIRAGLKQSALVDMRAHTLHLEQAYLEALRKRHPAALGAAALG